MTPEEIQKKRIELEVEKKRLEEELDSWESCKRSAVANTESECRSRGLGMKSVEDVKRIYWGIMSPKENRIAEIEKELEELQKSA